MAVMNIEQVSADMPLSPLYIIHGEEDLLRIEALDTLRAAAKKQGYLNREVFTADNGADWDELLQSAGSAGLFADLKLLEIHIPNGKPGKNGGDVLLELAQNPPPDTLTLVVMPKLERSQQQSKWFAGFAKNGTVYEAKPVGAAELPAWIRRRLNARDLDIDGEALSLFASRVEGNLLAAAQEIDKLALLYPKGHLLTLAEAENAVANVARFDVFQLSSAWMRGDIRRSAQLLEGLQAEGEEPVLLLWSLSEDIRTLIRLSAALKQGRSVQSVRNELHLWGDKQHSAPPAAARISPARLTAALQECARIDRQIKGAEDGDAWDGIKRLITRLAA